MNALSEHEQFRYKQHIKLANISHAGQMKLKNARVLCIGAGGLGSPLLLYLAAAGVGTLGIVDNDDIQLHNLQRQILYQQQHIGQKKVAIAQQQLTALNEHVNIITYPEKLNLTNALDIISQYDIIADCSDNFTTRYLVNDACFQLNKPYVYASILEFTGQCSVFLGKSSPCFRCVFPEPSSAMSCQDMGVLGVLPGLLGTIQATEIMKWILSLGDLLAGRLLTIDALKMQFSEYQFTKNPDCDLCAGRTISSYEITAEELKPLLENDEILLLDVRTALERQQFHIGGVWIPLNELAYRTQELDKTKPIVAYCKSGVRSMEAVKILLAAGFASVKNLTNGLSGY